MLTFGLAMTLISLSPITSVRLRSDWTWFLCLTAGAIFTLVVWATRRLRTFTQELATALCIPNSRFLHQRLVKCLSDRHMFAFASGAGLLNAALGIAYGLWPADQAGKLTLVLLFFATGSICGLAVNGIVTILDMVWRASRMHPRNLSLLHPDGCGGTAQVGRSLLFFSTISLIAGVLIGIYIHWAPWSHRSVPIVQLAILLWTCFPHAAAVTLLGIPLIWIHRVIRDTKAEQTELLMERMMDLQDSMRVLPRDTSPGGLEHFLMGATAWQHLSHLATTTHDLREWPFHRESSLRYVFSVVLAAIPPLFEVYGHILVIHSTH